MIAYFHDKSADSRISEQAEVLKKQIVRFEFKNDELEKV